MTGIYKNAGGSIYEVYIGSIRWGKDRKSGFLCKRIKCDVEGAVLNDPYPIEKEQIQRNLKMGVWTKIEYYEEV